MVPRKKKISHPAADALDWEEAMSLIRHLNEDGKYRNAMLISCGCFLGLRISDILQIRWCDLLNRETLVIVEKKTGKERHLKVNEKLAEQTRYCHRMLAIEDDTGFIMSGQVYGIHTPMTRQWAAKILKSCKSRYGIRSAEVFSTHSLRKTFGRRVYMQECKKGKGDQALLLLQDVFGHSTAQITKRYLGIRQDEINSVYDTLTL